MGGGRQHYVAMLLIGHQSYIDTKESALLVRKYKKKKKKGKDAITEKNF